MFRSFFGKSVELIIMMTLKKTQGMAKPLFIMVGAVAVTAGVLAYPASLYVCNEVYDNRIQMFTQHYGVDKGEALEIVYKESERSFTTRSGEFVIKYYDSNVQDNQERKQLFDFKFQVNTNFNFLGFETEITPDKDYGDFKEVVPYLNTVPKILSEVKYNPFMDKINYRTTINAFEYNENAYNKRKSDFKLSLSDMSFEIDTDRNSTLTPRKDMMAKIEQGAADFNVAFNIPNITLKLANQQRQKKQEVLLDLKGLSFSGTMLAGSLLEYNTNIESFNFEGNIGQIKDIQGVMSNLASNGQLLRNGETYGVAQGIKLGKVNAKALGQTFDFSDLVLDWAFVDMTKEQLETLFYFVGSSQLYGEEVKFDQQALLEREQIMERALDYIYQVDVNQCSFATGNNGKTALDGKLKLKIGEGIKNAKFDLNFDNNVATYLGGQNAIPLINTFVAQKMLTMKERKDSEGNSITDYHVDIVYDHDSFTLNGVEIPGL